MTITRGNNYKRKERGGGGGEVERRAFSGRIITEERIDIIVAAGEGGEGRRWRREGKVGGRRKRDK